MPEGHGAGEWGGSQWGSGEALVLAAPTITPLDPVDGTTTVPLYKPLSIRLSDDVGVLQGTITVSANGVILVMGGSAQNGATLTKTLNAESGYDLEITPSAPWTTGDQVDVLVSVMDTEGLSSSLAYFFTAGVAPRMIGVSNPAPGVLLAYFNTSMSLNADFLLPSNWVITPISEGAAAMEITRVSANNSQPDVAHLQYTGGGSTYQLDVANLVTQLGEQLEVGFNTFLFELIYGEEETPEVKLFDSVFGPLGITQRSVTRRTLDKHTADRATALALDEQFRLRFQQLDATIGRNGAPGKNRAF